MLRFPSPGPPSTSSSHIQRTVLTRQMIWRASFLWKTDGFAMIGVAKQWVSLLLRSTRQLKPNSLPRCALSSCKCTTIVGGFHSIVSLVMARYACACLILLPLFMFRVWFVFLTIWTGPLLAARFHPSNSYCLHSFSGLLEFFLWYTVQYISSTIIVIVSHHQTTIENAA